GKGGAAPGLLRRPLRVVGGGGGAVRRGQRERFRLGRDGAALPVVAGGVLPSLRHGPSIRPADRDELSGRTVEATPRRTRCAPKRPQPRAHRPPHRTARDAACPREHICSPPRPTPWEPAGSSASSRTVCASWASASGSC